jgi:hypothetical protein
MPEDRAVGGEQAAMVLERAFGSVEAASPLGELMTLDDLPSPGTKRWVIRRKAEVVAGVRLGLISLEEACRRYRLSLDEFLSWQRLIDRHGMRGLRATRVQEYRARQAERSATIKREKID